MTTPGRDGERLEQIKSAVAVEWRLKTELGMHWDHLSDLAFLITSLEYAEARCDAAESQLAAIDRIVPRRSESPDVPLVERVTQAVVQMQHDDARCETWRAEVEAQVARCEALETALRAVLKLREQYAEDDPQKACDECPDCGDIVMCRFHSLLSALEGRTYVDDELKVPTNLRALLSAEPPAPKEEQ